jgi:hypothetical protein
MFFIFLIVIIVACFVLLISFYNIFILSSLSYVNDIGSKGW